MNAAWDGTSDNDTKRGVAENSALENLFRAQMVHNDVPFPIAFDF
jgi:hypothetical protein